MASPTFAADGTPVVQAPESVVLRLAQTWKGYLVAQFHGNPPSLTKVFNDLNPIWGKQGRIKIKHHSKGVYMIFIPCEVTRQWVLDVAFWHSGNCSFTVTEWSPNFVYTKMKLEFAPVWVLFRNIPPELWSLEGFSSFATGVGFPVQSEYPKLKPYSNGIIKLKVVIKLEGKKPKVVKVVDKLGNSVNIYAEYMKLPPKCGICSEFGHFDLRCPVASLRPVPQETVDKPPSQELDLGTSPAVSKSNSKANPPSSPRASLPALESNSKAGASGGALRRSVSLPGSPVGSSKSFSKNGSSGWVRVGSKSPSKKSTTSKSVSAQALAEPLSSAHFDSEEELISAAQKIIRNRLSAVDTDLLLFSSGPERKKFRKVQRQTMRSLCEDDSAASEDFGVSVNNKFASLTFGSVEAVLPKQASTFLEA